MSSLFLFISKYIGYIAPPVIGAFIGYLTNRVAIRMLFRPLRPWRIFGIRVPMTPGVIPSKRHQLALNIGEMVGEHLLTSKEIGGALRKKKFKDHLFGLIKDRADGVVGRDLGPLPTLVPKKFASYYDIGIKTIKYHVKSHIHGYMRSGEFEQRVGSVIRSSYQDFLTRDIDTVLPQEKRDQIYITIESGVQSILASKAMEQWVEDFVYAKISVIVKKEKSLDDLLPQSLKELVYQTVESQTPELLTKFSEILKDHETQEKIISGVRGGVENFIATLGPMSAMVQNFISMDTVEEKIREYLQEKEGDIAEWLNNEELQERISASTLERVRHIFDKPLIDFLPEHKKHNVERYSKKISKHLIRLLNEKGTAETISLMVKENIELYIDGGAIELHRLMGNLLGEGSVAKSTAWLCSRAMVLLQASKTRESIDQMVEQVVHSLEQKPIGRLTDIVPAGVREGVYSYLQRMASAMLALEVPGLVDSLNIKHIVAEKIDSLDLFRLERLLLSIMEEQFKYINLFGALLGFIIGLANLLVFTIR